MSQAVSCNQPNVEQRLMRRLPATYVLVALFVTLLLTVLTPPFFVPDEPNHSLRALGIAHGHLLSEAGPRGAGGETDRNAYAAMSRMSSIMTATAERYPRATSRPDGRISRGDLAAVQHLTWAHADGFVPFPNTAVYPPALYVPQAAGWAIAEHLNLTISHGLVLARVCAALVSVLVGWLALRCTVCSRAAMFLVLLLPTCLSLNASTSQDAVLFGVAALASACLSRPLQQRRQFRRGELVLTAVLLTVCIGARVPYLPLLLVLLLPSLNALRFLKKSLLEPAIAAVCAALLVGVWQMRVRQFGVVAANGADVLKQQAFLHAHPLYGAMVVAKSTVLGSSFTVLKGLAWLGTNDAVPPLPEYGLLVFAMLVILLLSAGGCLHTWRARAVLAGAALASAAAMSLAEYLIWTVPGASDVAGLQSRYYLPLLTLLALALPGRPMLRLPPGIRRWALPAAYVAFLACIVSLPLVAAHRFYDQGLLAALRESAR
jgi:hypothetical protein